MSVNIMLLGNTAVGKTTFLQQYINKTFRDIGISTVGVDSETVNVVIDNEKEVTAKIWDTAGQEKFQAVFKSHYQKADGIILIYSVQERETYDKIQEWMNSIKNSSRRETVIFLVSNKNDLPEDKKIVKSEEGREIAQLFQIPFYEITSKSYDQVSKVVHDIVKEVINKDEDGNFRIKPLVLDKESFKKKDKDKCNC